MFKRIIQLLLLFTWFALTSPALAQVWPIERVTPANNSIAVDRSSAVSVAFSEPMDAASIDSASFFLYGQKSGRMTGRVFYQGDTRTALFIPTKSFLPGDQITAILSNKIRSAGGTSMSLGYVWNFTAEVIAGTASFIPQSFSFDLEIYSLTTADADQDGQTDLILTGSDGTNSVLQIRSYKQGNWMTLASMPIPARTRPVIAADLNRDGFPDYVLVHRDTTLYNLRKLSTCLSRADGTHFISQTIEITQSLLVEPRYVTISDWNGDGWLDIAVVKRVDLSVNEPAAMVYLNQGGGRFAADHQADRLFWNEKLAERITDGDFDNDGLIDLGISRQGRTKALQLFRNTGNAQFNNNADYSITTNYGSDLENVVSADLNNDGGLDLLVADRVSSRLVSYLNRTKKIGSISFDSGSMVVAYDLPTGLDVGDLDADGDLDAITSGYDSTGVSIFTNIGTGRFTLQPRMVLSPNSRMVAIADLNHDGALDAVLGQDHGRITLLVNKSQVNEPPQPPIPLLPLSGSFSSQADVSLVWRSGGDAQSDPLHFIVTVRGLTSGTPAEIVVDSRLTPERFTPQLPSNDNQIEWTLAYTLPADGDYVWSVRAWDGYFYSTASPWQNLLIDTRAPRQISAKLPQAVYLDRWVNTAARELQLDVIYSEEHPDRVQLEIPSRSAIWTIDSPPAGELQTVIFKVPAGQWPDARYDYTVTVSDSAGNRTDYSSWFGSDSHAPTQTLAAAVTDSSSDLFFTVFWQGGTDGSGSGLSGETAVRVRKNGGPWFDWLARIDQSSATFEGEQYSVYDFEAASYDQVGLLEAFTGIAETSVFVDTTLDDSTPPASPLDLTANGSNPSPWQSGSTFAINWINPVDESGIARSYRKLGTAPTFDDDFDAVGPASGPFSIDSRMEGEQPLYLWLEDGRGNRDYNHNARVGLRHDSTLPIVDSLVFRASPNWIDKEGLMWVNPLRIANLFAMVYYSENHAKHAELQSAALPTPVHISELPSGSNVRIEFTLPIAGLADGLADFAAVVVDSAGNSSQRTSRLGIDSTPPQGSVAQGPDLSNTLQFKITWTPGSDGEGSGLSGGYDVFVRKNQDSWTQWLNNYRGMQASFTGVHGNRYSFEALARDQVGNIETRLALAEASVLVDTTAGDTEPPPAPIDLGANGQIGKSKWQNTNLFTVTWIVPYDLSGVVKSYYKIGAQPTSATDYTDTNSGTGPLQIEVAQPGATPLYVWLEDKWGNVDFNRWALVWLRFDPQPPVILEMRYLNPGFSTYWYNPKQIADAVLQVRYQEAFCDSAVLTCEELNIRQKLSDVASGDSAKVSLSFSITGKNDGRYTVWIALIDSAGNRTTGSTSLFLDSTPPQGTIANSPDTSSTLSFNVNWSGGGDGNGVGLSGLYTVRVKENNGTWQNWLDQYRGTFADYANASHGSRYAFEVGAYDQLNNREVLTGTAESTTLVDTTADDRSAPPPPLSLTANDRNPSPWSKTPQFVLRWQLPYDESGISSAYYKIGRLPQSNSDYDGEAAAAGPANVKATAAGGQPVYVWLRDSRGNQDFHNTADVSLRYDPNPPVLHASKFLNPGADADWFNPRTQEFAQLEINYSDRFLDTVKVVCEPLQLRVIRLGLPTQLNSRAQIPLRIQQAADGIYPFSIALQDSAGNVSVATDTLRLDGTPPTGIQVIAPDTSAYRTFVINWTAGTDGPGVGINGLYDLHFTDNNGAWKLFQANINSRQVSFTGEHGHIYGFQVLGNDRLGNKQALTIAQARTRVDTTLIDLYAPSAPLQLVANGQSPSPWAKDNRFTLEWVNPNDPSRIARAFYKLGDPPAAAEDTTGSGEGQPPLEIRSNNPYGEWCHLWLQDGSGNVDFKHYSRVLLRYDPQKPQLDSLRWQANAVDQKWFNPLFISSSALAVFYNEPHLQQVKLTSDWLFDPPLTLSPGDDAPFITTIDFDGLPDSSTTIEVALLDSAGWVTNGSIQFALDSRPPSGTLAVSPDTTASGEFLVRWGQSGSDGLGSGLSGIYDVRVRIDNGDWQSWKTRFRGESALYSGEPPHLYAFEAAAYDRVGNRETLTGKAESQTLIDPNFGDQQAPAAPINVVLNGLLPNGWTAAESISISWQNPPDPSGIMRLCYAFSEPHAESDTAGTLPALSPATLPLPLEGIYPLYLWLEDGRGNRDFRNNIMRWIKCDRTLPAVLQHELSGAQWQEKWVNSLNTTPIAAWFRIEEKYPSLAALTFGETGESQEKADFPPGEESWTLEFPLDLSHLKDGCYSLMLALQDSAGNSVRDTLFCCVDATPPSGSVAQSPDTSLTGQFSITWSGAFQGSDGAGSGLDGRYDLRIRIDQGEWQTLREKYTGTTDRYVGVHCHNYAFEVAAWDRVGNREPFWGEAETITRVDTTTIDVQPPPPPSDLLVDGRSPSPWQSTPIFLVNWQEPVDPSGIAAVYFKLGDAPEFHFDTTGTALPLSPLRVAAQQENGQWLHIWLRDRRGNLDYTRRDSIYLRYDATPPRWTSIAWVDPPLPPDGYNPDKQSEAKVRLTAVEANPGRVFLRLDNMTLQSAWQGSSNSNEFRVPIQIQPDGARWLVCEISDLAGNMSLADSVRIRFDSVAPRVELLVPSGISSGNSVQIQAHVREENPLLLNRLLYRMIGQSSGKTVDFSQKNDSLWTAVIPSEAVAERGLAVVAQFSDGLNQTRLPAADADPNEIQLRVGVAGVGNKGLAYPHAWPGGTGKSAYRMISMPLELSNPSVEAVFGDDLGEYQNVVWRLFHWNSARQEFIEYPELPDVVPGRAYWLITRSQPQQITSGRGLSVDADQGFVVELHTGWNDIGHPYAFPVSWRDILLATAVDTQAIIGPYTYNGAWLLPDTDQNRAVRAWSGFSIYTEQPGLSLVIPPIESTDSEAVSLGKESAHSRQRFQLQAKQGLEGDFSNYFGFRNGSTPGYDRTCDFVEPHPLDASLCLYFDRPNWPLENRRFASDFRPPAAGDTWTFAVETRDFDLPVQISLHVLNNAENHQVVLIDSVRGRTVSLSRDSVYTFRPTRRDSLRTFQIVLGTAEYLQKNNVSVDVPQSFGLDPVYPNPFNSYTAMPYRIAKEGEITLALYNTVGQLVRILVQGHCHPGYYEAFWDGLDSHGRPVASGVYFIRLNAKDFQQTNKLLLLK